MSKSVIRCALLAGASLLAAGPALAQSGTDATVAPGADSPNAATGTQSPEPAPPPASRSVPPSEPGTGGTTGLQEIVVTAQRRAENLQKVPVAVTALSAAKLDDLRIVSASSLSGLAPSLTINSQGLASNPTIIIRGISSGVSNNGVDPKIGTYLDGVYIGRTVGALFDLADIQRIEVLRGPQGTLFGRNATGGALSIVTAPPKGEFGVRGTVSYGNYDAKRAKVSIDLPRFGPFSARVSYLHDDRDGDVKNLVGGQTIDIRPRDADFGVLKYAKRLGARNTDAVQVAVRGEFGNVTADYHFDYSDARNVGRPVQAFGVPNDATGGLVSAVELYDTLFGAGITNDSTKRLKAVANATSEERVVTQGHSLTLTARDDDNGIVVKNIMAYRKFKQYPNIFDLAGTGGLRFTTDQLRDLLVTGGAGVFLPPGTPGAIPGPGPNDSFFTLLTSRTTKQAQFSDEAQVQITKDAFDLTAGVFLFHERSPATDVLGIAQTVDNGVVVVGAPIVPGFPAAGTLDAAFGSGVTRTVAVNDSIAGYAQLTLHVTPTLDVVGGGRYTIDDRSTKIISISGGQGGQLQPGTYKVSYEKFTYTGIVNWRPNNRTTVYGKVSTGYVAGGLLNAIPYKPETLQSFELGYKGQFFNNRLRANLAGFYSIYNKIQLQNFVNGVQLFENAGKSHIKGIEAEIEAAPVRGLTLSGNFSWTDFKYVKFIGSDPFGVVRDIADIAHPVYFPKYQARGSIQYDAPEFSNGAHIFGRIDGTYRSSITLASPAYQAPAGASTAVQQNVDRLNKANLQPGLFLLDGRVGVAGWSLGGAKVALSAFGKNLTNKKYVAFGAPVLRLTGAYETGRTYGVELGFEF